LSAEEERRIGMQWSDRLVRRARLAVQGTIDAAEAALRGRDRLAANLAGGTHHALRDAGEGYCTLNDVAVAVRFMQREYGVGRVLVVDLDVHHGNGTAAIFTGDPSVFTFSMHGAKNFPLKKPPSSLDVPLPDGLGDDDYLATLEEHLPRAVECANADIAFYLAGVDVAKGDRFGRLALSEAGIAMRDRLVLERVWGQGIATCMTLSGGYATGVDGRTSSQRTAELHAIAHREANAALRRSRA
jgi:acetoin utilization deacetylase AcuC-like enzyme